MKRNLCLFDLDHTLLPIDSDHTWGQFVVKQGWVDPVTFAQANDHFYAQYQAGTLDIHEYVAHSTQPWREKSMAEMNEAHGRFMAEFILPAIQPAALALVRQHQSQGDLVALVTATNEFVTQPIAVAFGIEHLLAVRLQRDIDGRITGRIDGEPSFREGKIVRTRQWLEGMGFTRHDFDRVFVYSDSINDLPLLESATDPVATNPSLELEAIARDRGWRILQLFNR